MSGTRLQPVRRYWPERVRNLSGNCQGTARVSGQAPTGPRQVPDRFPTGSGQPLPRGYERVADSRVA
eukprot:473887-Lingulodinium_polyedra.AAC.1